MYKAYDKKDDLRSIVYFWKKGSFLLSYSVSIPQLTRLASVCSEVLDFSESNNGMTAKLFRQGFRYYNY